MRGRGTGTCSTRSGRNPLCFDAPSSIPMDTIQGIWTMSVVFSYPVLRNHILQTSVLSEGNWMFYSNPCADSITIRGDGAFT